MIARTALFAASMLALVAGAQAACPTDEEVAAFVEARLAGELGRALAAESSMEDARCAQEKVIALLEPHLGEAVGYKAGLTSKPAQEAFGASGPVWGVLFGQALGEAGDAPVPVEAGMLYEADMLAVVADAAVNDAETPEEVARHLEAVIPFIELPSIGYAQGEPLDAVTVAAANVGAWKGVMGERIPVEPSPDFVEVLAEMQVVMTDGAGNEVMSAPGAAILGHPLNAVIYVADQLAAQGEALEAGDVVSLGSFGPLRPARPGEAATVRYEGLPGDPEVSVSFE